MTYTYSWVELVNYRMVRKRVTKFVSKQKHMTVPKIYSHGKRDRKQDFNSSSVLSIKHDLIIDKRLYSGPYNQKIM